MKEQRISEAELVLPSLYLMYLKKSNISTSDLINLLTKLMKPTGQDIQILANRNDTYFSQKVRNLKSHDTLTKNGFAIYNDGGYTITTKGIEYVKKYEDTIKYLFQSGFDYVDVRSNLGKIYKAKKNIVYPYSEVISEGGSILTITKSFKRSQKLRNAALEHFSHDGLIECDCCGFEFRNFYGENYGKPCIEIHHMKPIFQYSGISISQTIDDALKNLLPVCPNCHRVIHKNNITAAMLPNFKQEIARQHFIKP